MTVRLPKPDTMAQSIESASFMFFTKRIIGEEKDPYLIRWIIFQTPWLSLYVHKMVRSDYERALHDHPWPFISLVLSPYAEWWYRKHGSRYRINWGRDKQADWNTEFRDGVLTYTVHKRGDILVRGAHWRHRVIVEDLDKPGWTMVLTGPRVRWWGFWPKGSWCHWKSFNMELGICESEPIPGRKGLN